jgi:hypothetical protein
VKHLMGQVAKFTYVLIAPVSGAKPPSGTRAGSPKGNSHKIELSGIFYELLHREGFAMPRINGFYV